MTEGLLTIAFGPEKYARMAKALSRSYRRFDAPRPFAVVTDSANAEEMKAYFDLVIPLQPEYGGGVIQKLHLDLYAPFQKTLFVDSDCLFYKDPERAWQSYDRGDFVVRGWGYAASDGSTGITTHGWVDDLAALERNAGISRLSAINGGLYFLTEGEVSRRLFETAREVYANREQYCLRRFKGVPANDEPVIGVAMEKCGIEMLPWDNVNGMETATELENRWDVNVLEGRSKFMKSGRVCEPTLIHFNVGAQTSPLYHLEMLRLEGGAFLKARVAAHNGWFMTQLTVRRLARRIKAMLGK